ncbi:MAG: hypothetical protein QG657_2619 [Acidobacteriota bacterium]|nr:hypothetical protein [Acidobacteriota bacterium]
MTKTDQKNIETGLEIAIIGMAGKFPGAGTLDQFWENLKNGVETISFFTCEELKEYGVSETLLNNPDYVKASGVLNGKEYFDSSFFGFSPKEAESMDPQIRLFLESSWETLEDAGYDSTSYKGAVGVYAGITDGFSWRAARMLKDLRDGVEQTVHLLDTSLLLSTRVSHKLDLKGPSITLYTACSTSLVAVHQACRSLLTGECDMALAGAVSVQPIDKSGYLYQEGMILSPDGHNRSFDAQAKGTIFSEGIGIILLKRLKDALADGDAIKSVIKASAVNNDGIGKSSFTAPGKKRIADVIRTALKLSRWSPGYIGYIEAHGTATALGDAIEVEAMKEALNCNKKAYCAIGSVKSNIGHLDVAAGMAGLIKTVQAIQHRLIPPSLYFETPNPKIDFIDSPFYINAVLTPWENLENPLRAGVCSFGIGGTNAFIFLEEPPVRAELETAAHASTVPQLFLLSARTDSALETMTRNLAGYFKNNPGVNLADVAYTLQVGRKAFSRRRMFICSTTAEAVEALTNGVDPFAEDASAPVELLRKAGTAWLEKGTIEGQQKARRISLPTYPFERQRYWIDGIGGDPLSALSSPKEKGDTGPIPAKIEKTVNKETPGLYQRPQLSSVYEPPADEIEQALTDIWQRFFGIREVGVLDDFFELGGDSLKVITVVTEIHKQMDARVSIPQVFDTPTIRGLAGHIKSKGAGVDKYIAIEPVEKKEYYPLSSAQMRIYILQQLEIHSTGYNTPLLFIWEGRVDRQRMENVFQSLVARHESLRTSFELIDGEVVQRIHNEVEFKIEYKNLSTDYTDYTDFTDKKDVTLHHSSFMNTPNHFIRAFDMANAPLMRVGLAETGNDTYLFMVDMHHSVTDGSSIGILIREFAALYTGETLPELRIQYKDYTHWQSSDKQKEVVKAQETYWSGVFEGDLPVLNLPLDYPRPVLQSFEGNRTGFEISREEAGALRSLALKEDATLFMVLLSLYNILLAKICGQEDIVIGTPIAGRNHADLQRTIGMLVNTLALRNAPMGGKTFREFLKEVRKNTLAAFENQDYPFEDLEEQVTRQINRDISRNPVFDTIFNLLNFESQYENNVKIEVPGMTLRPYEYERGIAIFDLSLEAEGSQDGVTFTFEFCTKLFKPGTIDRFIGYFKKIVTTVAAAPDQKIAQIEILSDEEKQQILRDSSGPMEEFAEEPFIHDLFLRQAKKTPDHVAIFCHGRTLFRTGTDNNVGAESNSAPSLRHINISYRQLHEQSDRMAGLLNAKGVQGGDIVGIMLPRSIEMVISILATLKANAAYLPIDPELPQERIDYMLKDSGAKLLAVANNQEGEKVRKWEGEKIHLEEISKLSKISSYPLTFLPSYLLSSSNLIYIIYTSGSTGRPKGVMLEHRNVRNLLLYQYRYTSINFSRVLQFTTISFDVSFQEIFSTLLAGGMLVLADIEIIRDFPRLFEVIELNILKTLFLPASFLKFVFNQEEYAAIFPSCVEHIVTAGEQPIVTDRFKKYLKANGVYLHNHYGPTETHVVTALTIVPASEIPALPSIGKPLANTQIYIVDKEFHLLPVGIAGELIIGGVQVGRGYLNNPELTRGSFEKPPAGTDPTKLLINYHSPFTTHHSPLYRTGDLAKWLPNGNIEFLGRIDFQVKIRGYRVELGEIESKLMTIDHVKEAVVVAGKNPKGEMYLCAYIVPINPELGNKETLAGLRKTLAGVLPDYMTPSHFMFLDKIPLTASGKVNRKALPEPVFEAGADYFAPGGPVETGLIELWSQVLGIEKHVIGVNANFFELGGHSLKAAVLTAKIHKYFYVDIPLGDIFKHPTIMRMADYIKQAEEELFASISPVEESDYYPLSSAQKRLYIIQHLAPGSTAYNMPSAMIIEERIDKQRLENTFRQLIRRHESFRTSFVAVEEKPVQRVHKNVEFEIAELGVRDQGTVVSRGDPLWSPELIKNFIRPFDLSRAPLLRVGLSKLGEEKYLLMVDMHHIVSDGTSIRILTREFIRFYLGDTLAEFPVQYKDFTCWQQSALVKQKTAAQEYYWIKRFSGDIPVLTLPIDYPRPAVQGFEGSNYIFEMEEKETAALNHLARQHEATLFMVLVAVFNVLLARLSGQEDIIIGTPIAGRRHTDLEPLIGMFVNTLALRHFPAGELTFAAFFGDVRTRTLKDFENQDCQFEDVVEKVVVRRDAGRSPLFDVMFALQNIEELKPGDVPNELELRTYGYDFERLVSRFDMTWNIIEKSGRLVFNIEYSTLLFKKDAIARFSEGFKKVAAAIIAFSDLQISQVEIIAEEERRRILDEFNAVWTEYPRNKTIHRLFQDQVEKSPDRIAVFVGPARAVGLVGHVGQVGLTYKKLNKQSDRMAGLLIAKSVQGGDIVGIMLPRSVEMIIGILAILKAGGAYLPIDPDYPQERIDYMLRDSGTEVLLAAEEFLNKIIVNCQLLIVNCKLLKGRPRRGLHHSSFIIHHPSHLSYIIYTSGSTGKPKGVMVEHRSVVRLVKNTNYITFNTGDRILQTGALEFDASTFEIWGALLNGLTLYLASKEDILKSGSLKTIIRTYDIGIMWMTSPLFDYMVEVDIEVFSGLRYFLVGGDVLSPFHIDQLRNRYPRLNVINGYGPTENTTFSTTLSIDGEYAGSIPIGRPIANSSAYILDNYGILCPIGVGGELYVGGDGVARGYLNNPELTAEKFNRSYKSYKTYVLYKTGDLARWLPDGNIEFLGRIDHQVKISGYRVEPGEVRQQLLRHPQIREAVVTVRETQTAEKYLCAYIVLQDSYISGSTQSTNPAELREFLLRVLPDYMVPAHFITIEKIPLTANGKVDTKVLPEPAVTLDEHAVPEAPLDEIEECLLDTWSQVLALEKNKIGRHDDFFQLGGHSLKAAVSIARIHKELNVEVPLVEIFKTPTAAGLAEYIRKHLNSREKYTSIEPTEKKEYYNLSPAQKRMYLLHLMEPEGTVYNIPQFFGLDMEFRRDKLEQIFRQLIQRHESFRTSFITVDEEPVQRIHQEVEFEIEYYNSSTDYTDYTDKKDNITLHHSSFMNTPNHFIRPFDLANAPLLRVGVTPVEFGTLLMVDMHHIVSDGVSMDILVREFLGLSRGEVFPGLRLQYKDYAQWQNSDIVKRKTKFQEKYWLREFSGGAPILELPTDFVRPEVQSFEGGSYYFELGKEEGAALNHLAHQQGATLYIVLLTMFDILLFKLSGQEDIVVGTPTAGRGHADLEAVIGMFVNTLALRNFPGPDKTITEFLQEVKTNTLRAFENQDFPFEDLVEKAVVKRDSSRSPLFDVMFTLQNVGNAANIGIRDSSSEPGLNVGKKVSRFDMTWAVTEKENRLVFEVEYCTRLFKEETIKRFGEYFKKLVNAIMDRSTERIGDIEIILDEERQRLLYEFNRAVSEDLGDKTVTELIEEQTERTPDRISLVNTKTTDELHEISYRELNEKSNYLAYVLREKGVLPDAIVALKIERSVEMIIGVLGILKASGAYLPIEPEYPEERIDYMLKDSGAKILVNEKFFRGLRGAILQKSPPCGVNLAYIIYTSGSTGKPKGVLVEHRNLTAYVRAFLQEFKLGPGDIGILEASFAFDAFVEEVYPILTIGGRLSIARKQEVMDGHLLEAFFIKNNITIISCSPLLLNEINRFSNLNRLPIHTFISGADVLKKEYIGSLLGPSTVYNVYGPTETTVCASYYRLPGKMASIGVNIPIGKPITGYRVYILDEEHRLLTIGAPGEICIAGNGVTRGYLNNPGLTAQKFIIKSFAGVKGPAARGAYKELFQKPPLVFYKTGDLGRWLPDPAVPGSYVIEFLGRIDRQVKIRGFRIELGEIESQLLQHATVNEATVIEREDANKDKYLCAYIIPIKSNTCAPAELKEFLSRRLPAYMIPAYFVCLDKFPLTTSGKIDRRALPVPSAVPAPALSEKEAAKIQVTEEPDGIETKLASLWTEILGTDRGVIGRETNFFEIGGHSLKATVLTGKIHKELGVRVPLVEIFRTPTIKGLAEYIRGAKEEAFFAVEPVEEREYYPLSSAQRRLYVLHQMDLESTVYHMPIVVSLDMAIDKDRLEMAAQQLVQRHESFRTSFVTINEEPVQRVQKNVDFTIEYYDLGVRSQRSGVNKDAPLWSPNLIKNFIHAFDLSKAPLLRLGIIKLDENKCILMVDIHHIISDGVSMDILIQEFEATYEGKRLPALRIQYKDYTHWQNSETVKEKIKDQEEYWLKELSGDIPILDLPFDYPRPQVQSFVGKYFRFTLDREETALLRKTALEQGVTMFLILTAIYNLILYKLSGQEDIVIGTPIAGRRHADLQGIIGMFVNTLVLKNYPSGNKTFAGFLEEVKTRTLRAFENQDYQFEDLVEKVSVGRDPGRNPLFDVVFTWQEFVEGKTTSNENTTDSTEESAPNLYESRVARFDMTWFTAEENNCLTLGIEYCTKLFKPETIERFSTYFKKTVSQVIAAPNTRIAEIDIISEEEQHRLLYDFNCRETEYPNDKTISQLFAEQVEKSPDRVGLVADVGHVRPVGPVGLTYHQLHEQSDQLAGLLWEKGALPGDIAAIMIERSNEMIIGLLGILKSGCAYLPINTGFPQERVQYMLEDSNAKILLGMEECKKKIMINCQLLIVNCKLASSPQVPSHHSSFINHHSNHLAYIIYTSGSTGNPKGVPITHANLSPLLHWGYHHLGINEKDRTIQNLSYYFDWSVWEIFITLTTGASLFMITEELLLNPEKSVAFIRQHAITVLHVTPTQYRYYLAAGQKLETLRYLFIGAESLGLDLVKRSFQSVNDECRVFNMYGPTEATIIASVLEIERSKLEEYRGLSSIPIGSPVGNSIFLILDKNYKVCPINVTGELYIGGGGLAQGYLNNPELTRGSFEKPPLDPVKLLFNYHLPLTTHYSPLYRTGDLARWLNDGNIEFLGRSDFQVKIRGYRIELGEIENRLIEHPSVREAVVLALDISSTGKDYDEKYLCAYIVPGSQGILNTVELKEFLSRSLPDYMIPSYFVSIDHIPLNPNGKVDRRALPGPEIEAGDKYEAPSSEIEKKLVDIWSEILGLDKGIIGIHDDFFERGGHSLKAAILVSRIQKEFCINVPLVEVFKTPTVKGLGEYIDCNINRDESGVPVVEDETLVLLRGQNPRGQDARHLFLVHAGNGEVEGYIELCSRLDDRVNCWGLRVDRVDRVDRRVHYTPQDLPIEVLAARYIEKIKKIQPTGPYFILGWCIGGTIAFEMTRQLEQKGEKPGTLFLVNAYAPFNEHKGKTHTFNIRTELRFLECLNAHLKDKQLQKKLKKAVDIEQIWRYVVDYLEDKNPDIKALRQAVPWNIADAMPDTQNIREFIYYVNITRSLDLARAVYNPAGNGIHISKCNTDVHFFGATRSAIMNKNQWPDYFEKPVKFYAVEGDHFSIFKSPDVITFAEQFNRVF